MKSLLTLIDTLTELNARFSAGSFAYGSGDASGSIHTDDGTLMFDDMSICVFIDGVPQIGSDRNLSHHHQLISLYWILEKDLVKLHKTYDLGKVQEKIYLNNGKDRANTVIELPNTDPEMLQELLRFISERFAGHKYLFTVDFNTDRLLVTHLGKFEQPEKEYLDASQNIVMSLKDGIAKEGF